MTIEEEQEALKIEPNFQVLLSNLYTQAKQCATSPFEKEKGFANFSEIAVLDFLIYFKSIEKEKLEAMFKK